MPAKRTPRAADQPGADEPVEAAVEATGAEGAQADQAEVEEAEVEEVPLNRAERRARGKAKPQSQSFARGKVSGGHGPAHTQRMWSNRRSGG